MPLSLSHTTCFLNPSWNNNKSLWKSLIAHFETLLPFSESLSRGYQRQKRLHDARILQISRLRINFLMFTPLIRPQSGIKCVETNKQAANKQASRIKNTKKKLNDARGKGWASEVECNKTSFRVITEHTDTEKSVLGRLKSKIESECQC